MLPNQRLVQDGMEHPTLFFDSTSHSLVVSPAFAHYNYFLITPKTFPNETNQETIALQSTAKSEGWDAFKHCLQHEMISLKKPSY